jgi:hypothetical protein
MNGFQRLLHRPFFIRLLHWEYWSFSAVYMPVYFIWLLLCLRARSFFFFAAANPRIRNGGFLNESKKDLYFLAPQTLQPKTVFFQPGAAPEVLLKTLEQNGMRYPLIGKPDVGGRGRGVAKLTTPEEACAYGERAALDFHIQEFVPYEKEVGIFYYRYPSQSQGRISGIVRKEFLKVTGDGSHTVKELLLQNKRGILQLGVLEKTGAGLLREIPAAGEEVIVAPYGNHARGAEFLDDSGKISPRLTETVDALCRMIPEFYFGRLDIRYQSWELLEQGKAFIILEVNGAGSEPTHMYDPRHSLFFAWKEIVRHWIILWRISRQNHRKGFRYLSLKEGIQMFREDKENSRKLDAMG